MCKLLRTHGAAYILRMRVGHKFARAQSHVQVTLVAYLLVFACHPCSGMFKRGLAFDPNEVSPSKRLQANIVALATSNEISSARANALFRDAKRFDPGMGKFTSTHSKTLGLCMIFFRG